LVLKRSKVEIDAVLALEAVMRAAELQQIGKAVGCVPGAVTATSNSSR